MKSHKYDSAFWWCLLLGTGMSTQVYLGGCIGISEIVMLVITPRIFYKDYSLLRRDGFLPVLNMFGIAALFSIVSAIVNKSPAVTTIKFLASMYSTVATIIVFHRALRINPYSIGGYLFGSAISGIISIFAFHPQANVAEGQLEVDATVEEQMEGVLFWISKIKRFLLIPNGLWYYETPLALLVMLPLAYAAFCLMTSVSGRAAALVSVGAGFMILWGQKSRIKMRSISRHFLVTCIALALILVGFKTVYSYSASKGLLGEDARKKYVHQTQQGSGMLKLLMAGRAEFFVGARACIDKPWLGWGSFPIDTEGYWYNFMRQYGNTDDFDYFLKNGQGVVDIKIPEHSILVIYWLHCGLPGLILWLYVLYLVYDFIKHNLASIPQLFGYFMFALPNLCWDIFFTPLVSRIGCGMVIAAMLMARAITRRRFSLPVAYEMEALRYDNR